jgi:purine nucleosidase
MDVIFVQDAAIDEYMAQVLLATMPVNLLGVVIVNADCIDSAAMQTAWKVETFIGATGTPLGLSRARGWNPFPWPYRGDCVKMGGIGVLSWLGGNPSWPPFPDGDALLERLLSDAAPGVTVLITSPLTPLAELLQRRPELEKKIGQIVWMGGAIRVGGNLDPTTVPAPPANGCAEWNAFWDPAATDWIFRNTTCPIVEFPLDMTNQAAVATSFMAQLQTQATAGSRWSQLAYESYGIVASESFYDMWDVATTCWLVNSQENIFAPPTTLKLRVHVELDGPQGCIKEANDGRDVKVVFSFAQPGGTNFYQYVANQFNR